MIQEHKLCVTWYPINKSMGHQLELYYCFPIKIEKEYSTCELFHGDDPEKLKKKGTFNDVCTADLIPIKLERGSKVSLPDGYVGRISKITKKDVAWVKVHARWGGFSKKVTSKTFKYSLDDIEPYYRIIY